MSGTTAMATDLLTRAAFGHYSPPLCPQCVGGRLHPYVVEFDLGYPGWQGVTGLSGWVAVCKGAKAGEDFLEEDVPPCGFSMPLTPHRTAGVR